MLWDFGGVITTSPFDAFNAYEAENGLPKDLIRQRATVVLRHLYGYEDQAIAGLLGCRVATVRSNARHGLARLREVLP